MLVLSRKKCQRIRLGDEIVLTIVDVGGDRVKVGIEAPSHIDVVREEISGPQQNLTKQIAKRAA